MNSKEKREEHLAIRYGHKPMPEGFPPKHLAAAKLAPNCRYCSKPVEESEVVMTASYWSSFPDICHAVCKDAGEREEAFECQKIDADCNDCKHLVSTYDGPEVRKGNCLKFSKPVTARPNFCSNLPCFEHRRA